MTKKQIKIDYKAEYKKLEKQCNKLQIENNLLRTFNKPTAKQKLEILDEYYDWIACKEFDANAIITFNSYKRLLKNQMRDENECYSE